jgi:PleD family two-component response regulator
MPFLASGRVDGIIKGDKAMSETTDERSRVLVVDDNQDAATSMALVLRAAGYDVATSFDGKGALHQQFPFLQLRFSWQGIYS